MTTASRESNDSQRDQHAGERQHRGAATTMEPSRSPCASELA